MALRQESVFTEHVTSLKGIPSFALLALTSNKIALLDWPWWAKMTGTKGAGVFAMTFANQKLGKTIQFKELVTVELGDIQSVKRSRFGLNNNILEVVASDGRVIKVIVTSYELWEQRIQQAVEWFQHASAQKVANF